MTKRDEAYEIIRKLYDYPAIHWFQHKYEVQAQWPKTLEEMDEDVALEYAKGQHVILTLGPKANRHFVCWEAKFYER